MVLPTYTVCYASTSSYGNSGRCRSARSSSRRGVLLSAIVVYTRDDEDAAANFYRRRPRTRHTVIAERRPSRRATAASRRTHGPPAVTDRRCQPPRRTTRTTPVDAGGVERHQVVWLLRLAVPLSLTVPRLSASFPASLRWHFPELGGARCARCEVTSIRMTNCAAYVFQRSRRSVRTAVASIGSPRKSVSFPPFSHAPRPLDLLHRWRTCHRRRRHHFYAKPTHGSVDAHGNDGGDRLTVVRQPSNSARPKQGRTSTAAARACVRRRPHVVVMSTGRARSTTVVDRANFSRQRRGT